jgi:hypothetical protein
MVMQPSLVLDRDEADHRNAALPGWQSPWAPPVGAQDVESVGHSRGRSGNDHQERSVP